MSLLRERHDLVEVLTIDRPQARNALDTATSAAIAAALRECDDDPHVAVVVLTGSGDKAFSAGMDLKEFAAGGRNVDGELGGRGARARRTPPLAKPLIAAVNGAALAGGLELMLSCDLVVAAEHASFGVPEVKRGLFAAGGGTRLASRIPFAMAAELLLTGGTIDAPRALELGLVNRVVPAANLLDATLELAAAVAANGPLGLRASKELLWAEIGGQPDPDRYAALVREVFSSADAREGATAFAERRPPRWLGK